MLTCSSWREIFVSDRYPDHLPYIPIQTQRQDALMDQLRDLVFVANRLGMYDAADWMSRAWQV